MIPVTISYNLSKSEYINRSTAVPGVGDKGVTDIQHNTADSPGLVGLVALMGGALGPPDGDLGDVGRWRSLFSSYHDICGGHGRRRHLCLGSCSNGRRTKGLAATPGNPPSVWAIPVVVTAAVNKPWCHEDEDVATSHWGSLKHQ